LPHPEKSAKSITAPAANIDAHGEPGERMASTAAEPTEGILVQFGPDAEGEQTYRLAAASERQHQQSQPWYPATALDDSLEIEEGKINDTLPYRCLDRILLEAGTASQAALWRVIRSRVR
jgi:hypothetical protein